MGTRKFINLLAYIAMFLIVAATIFSYLSQKVFGMSSEVATICSKVSYYLAIFVTFASAFMYAYTKRNKMYTFLLVILLILLIVFMFIL